MLNETNPIKEEAEILKEEAKILNIEAKILEKQEYSANAVSKNVLVIAGAIIIAGALIAGAVVYSAGNGPRTPAEKSPKNAPAITKADHLRGNMNAPVKIIEYSDTECPYCKQFHKTMNLAFAEYGPAGQLAWAYRHFPLAMHPKANKEAQAAECAGELGGNSKFWEYLDRIFEITPSNNGLDQAELPKIAEYIGLDIAEFNTCLDSGKYENKVSSQGEQAISAGAGGTPYSIIINRKGERSAIAGAVSYETLKSLIEKALK